MRLLPIALILALASPALAQESVRLGDRVRIQAPNAGFRKLVGQVTATTPDVISVKADGSVNEVAVPRADIVGMERSISSRRNVARAAFIGGTLGLFGALWFAKTPPQPGVNTLDAKSFSARNTLVGGFLGAGLGAFVGSFVRTDDWMPISAAPGAGVTTPALGISIRF